MLRVLLADDNILTLNQIAQIINNGDMGATVVSQVTDGDKAVQQLFRLKPDVIIADVEMPVMNGVELSAFIAQRRMPVKMIALSNYDNYEYVRAIMKNGAIDYLLKHEITPELLRSKLDEVRRQKEAEISAEDKEKIYSSLAKQSALTDILLGKQSAKSERNSMSDLADFMFGSYALVVLQIQKYNVLYHNRTPEDRQKISQSALDVCSSICVTLQNGIVCSPDAGVFAILFKFENNTSKRFAHEKASQYTALLSGNLSRLMGLATKSSIAVFMDDASKGSKYYNFALEKMGNEYAGNAQSHIDSAMNVYTEKRLLDSLYHSDRNGIREIAGEIVEGRHGEVEQAVCYVMDIIGRFENDYQLPPDHRMVLNRLIMEKPEANQLEQCIADCLLAISDIFNKHHIGYSRHVRDAVEYIKSCYNKDISLQDAAVQNDITGVYLSKKFSQEVGKTFIEYLNDYRIDMAKRIMKEDNISVSDIYQRVGFRSYSYFIKSFREKTGITPLQYMKKLR